jgi:hypothetical protein
VAFSGSTKAKGNNPYKKFGSSGYP